MKRHIFFFFVFGFLFFFFSNAHTHAHTAILTSRCVFKPHHQDFTAGSLEKQEMETANRPTDRLDSLTRGGEKPPQSFSVGGWVSSRARGGFAFRSLSAAAAEFPIKPDPQQVPVKKSNQLCFF